MTTRKSASNRDTPEETALQDALEHVAKKQQDTQPIQRPPIITSIRQEASFKRQMKRIQATMQPVNRLFSKAIHYRPIEKVSDAIGSTLARPNALLTGSIFAFIIVTLLYAMAKHYGYRLSGFETIGSFIIGWIIGLVYDYCKLLIRGKKSQ